MSGIDTPVVTPQSPEVDPFGFRDGDPNLSKLRFYSMGIVAANKPLNSKIVEVTPIEELPMLDGFIDDNKDTYTAQGVDADGQSYNSQVTMAKSLKAEWVPFCDSQRLSAPDVRRGERIVIYQFGDADKYYWTTWANDNKLRKLETVIWAFSGTKNEGDDITPETSYFFEVSTHKKCITLHTSQADGEAYGYDIQVNPKDCIVIIRDTVGNKILLNSKLTKLRMENASGSYLDITKQVAKLFTGQEINMETKAWKVDCDTATVNSTTTTVNGSKKVTIATPNLSTP
jgi:hypothetical protein